MSRELIIPSAEGWRPRVGRGDVNREGYKLAARGGYAGREVTRCALISCVGRQEEALQIAQELLADIELERLKASEIVLKASRLARLVGHDDLQTFLSYERNGYTDDPACAVWVSRAGRATDANDGTYWHYSIAKVEANLSAAQEAIQAMRGGGNFSGDMIALASREHDNRIISLSSQVRIWSGICGQAVATVYDLVVEIYHELLFSTLQATLFADTQSKVDGALATASGSALDKVERVSDRLRDEDSESVSQALTTCRRLIDSCADHLFAGRDEPYDLGDGATLEVGRQNVLNRLRAYCHSKGISKSRRDRLRHTLADLYGRCSAGTHAEVSVQEARFVFLQTYVALGEILTISESADSEEPAAGA